MKQNDDHRPDPPDVAAGRVRTDLNPASATEEDSQNEEISPPHADTGEDSSLLRPSTEQKISSDGGELARPKRKRSDAGDGFGSDSSAQDTPGDDPSDRPDDPSDIDSRPEAPTVRAYLWDGPGIRYQPQAAWYRGVAPVAPPAPPTAPVPSSVPDMGPAAAVAAMAMSGHIHHHHRHGHGPPLYGGLSFACEGGDDDNSILHIAAKEGNERAVKELLELGIPVNLLNSKGMTPLTYASQKGHLEITNHLLAYRANAFLASRTGTTPLIQAAHFGRTGVCALLLSHGVDPNQSNEKRTTPLMRAAQEGHNSVVELLIRNGADVSTINRDRMTPIMLASQRGHSRLVRTLIRAGAETDGRTTQESTPLILACKRGKTEVVKVLLASGTELTLRDSRGRTAHDTAIKNNMVDVAHLLCPLVQEYLMRREERNRRNYMFVKLYNLMQNDRAKVILHSAHGREVHFNLYRLVQCSQGESGTEGARMVAGDDDAPKSIFGSFEPFSFAVASTMMLPFPLMAHIAGYISYPNLFEKRLTALSYRCHHSSNQAIVNALELLDEILFEGGLPEACDMSSVEPPPNFTSWGEWKSWVKCGTLPNQSSRRSSSTTHIDAIEREEGETSDTENIEPDEAQNNNDKASFTTLFGTAGANHIMHLRESLTSRNSLQFFRLIMMNPKLHSTLEKQFRMPSTHLNRLVQNFDVQSLSRRYPECSFFEVAIAVEMFILANHLVIWYNCNSR